MDVSDPVIILNLKKEVIFINNAAQTVTGIKKIDAIGHSVDRVVRFYNKQNEEVLTSQYIPSKNICKPLHILMI
jgi:transcriptional regulator with PAS, ATPase and Fis domain